MCFYWVQFRFPRQYKYALCCSESRLPAFRRGTSSWMASCLADLLTADLINVWFLQLIKWVAALLAESLCVLVYIEHTNHIACHIYPWCVCEEKFFPPFLFLIIFMTLKLLLGSILLPLSLCFSQWNNHKNDLFLSKSMTFVQAL